ncbi:uncharacterized protein V6R79_021728 [Siganus canaliculatus]
MYRFKPYQGPSGGRGEISQLGMAGDVVMRLCEDLQDRNHKVFFDHFFCSIPILQALKHQGIFGTGTCRKNRLHGAQEKLKTEKQLKKEGRGSVSVVTSAQNITITRWMDSSIIHMASSFSGMSPTDEAERWSKKERKMLKVQRPFAVRLYNQHMGGVDKMDQMVAAMSGNEAKDLLHFKASTARSLINAGSETIRSRGRPSATPPPVKRRAVVKVPPEVWYAPGNHWPKLNVTNAMRCSDESCQRCQLAVCCVCVPRLLRQLSFQEIIERRDAPLHRLIRSSSPYPVLSPPPVHYFCYFD